MIRRILVPLDGSPRAERILHHVAALARVFDARLDLLHVVPGETSVGGGRPRPNALGCRLTMAYQARYLEARADELRRQGLDVWTRLDEGGPAEVIVDVLRRGEYDLVGLTPHGVGGDRRLRIGCTAVAVILNARTSILLAPDSPRERSSIGSDEDGYRRILAPVDCSPRSDWSLGVAVAVARGSGASLKVVHVLDIPHMVSRLPGSGAATESVNRLREANRDEASSYLEEVVWRLAKPDLAIEGEVIESRLGPAETLRNMACRDDFDLIVLSAHGQGASSEWPLGGTAAKLVFWAQRPVLILQDLPGERVRPERSFRSSRALASES